MKSYLPNSKVIFQPSFFRGYVKLREGIKQLLIWIYKYYHIDFNKLQIVQWHQTMIPKPTKKKVYKQHPKKTAAAAVLPRGCSGPKMAFFFGNFFFLTCQVKDLTCWRWAELTFSHSPRKSTHLGHRSFFSDSKSNAKNWWNFDSCQSKITKRFPTYKITILKVILLVRRSKEKNIGFSFLYVLMITISWQPQEMSFLQETSINLIDEVPST